MKISRIAAGVALLGVFTAANAESITFGVEVPPIASLVVRDGMLLSASTLYKGAAVTAATAENVGGFTLVTNMPKWNIYFGFANGGALKSQTGTQIKDNKGNALYLGENGGAAPVAGKGVVFLVTTDAISATDGTNQVWSGAAAVGNTPGVSTFENTLTKALAVANECWTGMTGATPKPCSFPTPWLQSFDQTTANFDLRTAVSSVGAATAGATALGSVAGTYTETMYLTLVTSY